MNSFHFSFSCCKPFDPYRIFLRSQIIDSQIIGLFVYFMLGHGAHEAIDALCNSRGS